MQIKVEKGAFWATITGTSAELDAQARALRAFAVGLDPTAKGHTMCLRTPDSIRVPAGAVLVMSTQPPVLDAPGLQLVATLAGRLRDGGLLRDYQARAVVAALCAPLGRATVDVAMGGGKTRIAAGLAAVAQAAVGAGNWLYLVQNGELVQQADREISELLPQLAAGLGTSPSARVTATTYAGVKKLASKRFDGVIVDECHLLPAPTRCLPYALIKAAWRVGLSGTLLDRQDTKNALIIALLGPRVCEVKIPELEKQGHLARGEVRVLKFNHGLRALVP